MLFIRTREQEFLHRALIEKPFSLQPVTGIDNERVEVPSDQANALYVWSLGGGCKGFKEGFKAGSQEKSVGGEEKPDPEDRVHDQSDNIKEPGNLHSGGGARDWREHDQV